jgi:formylglycine-generating enzyme required for sulfatase activity
MPDESSPSITAKHCPSFEPGNRPGDGLRIGEYFKYRVIRGGAYAKGVSAARSAHRARLPAVLRGAEVGVRLSRGVEFAK